MASEAEERRPSRRVTRETSPSPPSYGRLRLSMLLMTLFFVLASIVQLNDPDTLLWMFIYLMPGTLTFLAFLYPGLLDSNWWWLFGAADLGAHLAFSFAFISAAVDNDRLSWDLLHFEESRESCGLVITSIWLIFLLSTGSHKLRPLDLSNCWVTSAALVFSLTPLLCWVGYKVYWKMHCDVPEHCTGIL